LIACFPEAEIAMVRILGLVDWTPKVVHKVILVKGVSSWSSGGRTLIFFPPDS